MADSSGGTYRIELSTGQLCDSRSLGRALTCLPIFVRPHLTGQLRRHAHRGTHRHTHRAAGTSTTTHRGEPRWMDTAAAADAHAIRRSRWKTGGRGAVLVRRVEHGRIECRLLIRVRHVGLRGVHHRRRSRRCRGAGRDGRPAERGSSSRGRGPGAERGGDRRHGRSDTKLRADGLSVLTGNQDKRQWMGGKEGTEATYANCFR